MKKIVHVFLFAALLGVFACGGRKANQPEVVEEEVTVVAADTMAVDTTAAVVDTTAVPAK